MTPQVRGCYGTDGPRVEISIGGSAATAPTRTFRLLKGRRTIGCVARSCRQFQVVHGRRDREQQDVQCLARLPTRDHSTMSAPEQRSSSLRTRLAQEPAAERDRPCDSTFLLPSGFCHLELVMLRAAMLQYQLVLVDVSFVI